MQEGGADACEGVVHAGVSCWGGVGACVGVPVWEGGQRVCFSLKFFLKLLCWCLFAKSMGSGALGKGGRWKGGRMQEGWGGCLRGWCMLESCWGVYWGVCGGCLWGGLAWGERFCDESKMGDVVSFCCVNRLSKCCFAAFCFVLCCFVRCCCGFEAFLSPRLLEKYVVCVMSKIVVIVDQTAVKRVVVLRGKR